MKKCIITFSSMTYAIKAKHAFDASGINCNIVRLNASQSRDGCAYGIELYCSGSDEAIRILNVSDVSWRKVIRS